MNLITIILISLGLSMDAFAVSVSNGIIIKKFKFDFAFKIALFFGAFQAIMPVIGWSAGLSFKNYVSEIDHWIAFGLLGFIGGKMIYESFHMDKEKKELTFSILLMLSIAISIDALAVGISLTFLNVDIITPVIFIGIITFIMSFLGVFIGNRFGRHFENKIEFIGGMILICIGAKILIEHLI